MPNLVPVRVFFDIPEAMVVASCLNSAGINAHLFDVNYARTNWIHMVALSGIRVMVHRSDLDRAEEILNQALREPIEGDAETCPQCKSPDTFRRPSVLAAIAAYFAVTQIVLIKTRNRYCRACKYKWKAKE